MNKVIRVLTDALDEARVERDAAREEHATLTQEHEDLRDRWNGRIKVETHLAMKARAEQAEAEVKRLKAQVDADTLALATAKGDVQRLKRERDEALNEVERLKGKLSKQETDHREAMDRVEAAQRATQEARDAADREVERRKSEILDLERAVNGIGRALGLPNDPMRNPSLVLTTARGLKEQHDTQAHSIAWYQGEVERLRQEIPDVGVHYVLKADYDKLEKERAETAEREIGHLKRRMAGAAERLHRSPLEADDVNYAISLIDEGIQERRP